ncbi:MAG: Sulfur carrier protein adenylyltransferase ThiF [Thermoleophilia bacterium]|nr:Sulfur carrier protein adenylyltransferase ThiF [Thermoleophilia bacterium]
MEGILVAYAMNYVIMSIMESQIEVGIQDALDRRTQGAAWVDVRENDEWAASRIADTTHLPLAGAVEAIVERWPERDTPLNISCASGVRSMRAVEVLRGLGYTDAVNVAGGIKAWVAEGRPVESDAGLTPQQLDRYSRHFPIPGVGVAGQQALLKSRVLLLGAGGLGSPAALYLAAAGVGTIGLIDDDVVERSNLQRQLLHTESRIGVAKVDSARQAITDINPDTTVEAYRTRLTADNVFEILDHGWDVIIDGTDNLPTRYLINDASVQRGIPVVHGSIYRFEGQVTVFQPFEGPCYRCLYPEPPPPELAPSCAEGGVLGVLPGIVGSMQATEAIKLILGIGDPLAGRLMMYDALAGTVDTLKLRRDPECPSCGDGERLTGLIDYEAFCALPARA